jgi:hypothetical protein
MHDKAEPEHQPSVLAPVQAPAGPDLAGALTAAGGPATVGTIRALQGTAGNQAVTRWLTARATLARDGATAPTAPPTGSAAPATVAREDHVYLMGDPAADAFYREARGYYQQKYPKASITEVRSLAEVLAGVKAAKAPIGHLVIVSHAHEDGTLMFKLDANDPDNRLEYGELKKAQEEGKVATADQKIVDEQTSIEIRGCNIGRSPLMLDQIDKAFGGKAKVSAPTHEQHYAHDASGTYTEDFSGYFVEAPGNLTRSDKDLEPLFAAKYPFVDAKEWPKLLKKKTVYNDRQGPYGQSVLMPEPADALKAFGPTLDKAKPKADGWSHKFVERTANGAGYEYKFEASRLKDGAPEKLPLTIPADPPATADLEADARADLSRPDAYEYKNVKTKYDSKTFEKTFDLYAERTEWRIRHTVIKDASGPYVPPAGDKQYWGESSYTPP